MRWVVGLVIAVAVAMTAPASQAAFPGQNGRIAYSFDSPQEYEAAALYSINPDGTGKQAITPMNNPFLYTATPSWSPDGTKIAFADGCCVIYTANADGSAVTEMIPDSLDAGNPAWSPDGTKIAYSDLSDASPSANYEIYTVNPDGTGQVRVTSDPSTDVSPAWSPDGSRFAFESNRGPTGIWTMAADGSDAAFVTQGGRPNWSPDGSKLVFNRTVGPSQEILVIDADGDNETQLTSDSVSDSDPAWSPDGSKIVWVRDRWLYTMNADGSAPARLGTAAFGEEYQRAPDWQPIPVNAYPRPKGASPIHMPLVPAYLPCAAPNRTHGPPLAFGSCSPPERSSTYLTVGTPDANGQPAKSAGYARLDVRLGDPSTPLDEADVMLEAKVTDVRLASDLSDYTGALQALPRIRVTDKLNTPHPGGPGAATVTEFSFPFAIPCKETSDTTVGATCAVMTSADALMPGAVPEKRRAVWELGRFEVGDGGPQASPANRPFLVPGLFVP